MWHIFIRAVHKNMKNRHLQLVVARNGVKKVLRSGSVDRNLMRTVMEIEKAIEKLPTDELFELTH
jgi:hypothetical protein